jgi:hypothetical protein
MSPAIAYTERHIPLDRDAIFDVLADARTYSDWVVGAHEIRGVEGDWPQPGSRFHHTQGRPPLSVKDDTVALAADPPHRLEIEVRTRPFLVGLVQFTLDSQEGGTVVGMTERPIAGPMHKVHNPLLEWITKKRNDETLRRLERVAVARRRAAA